jgi:hypothetical protein
MMDGRALKIEKAVQNEGCEKYDRRNENTNTGRTNSCLRGCGLGVFALLRRVFFGRLSFGVYGVVLGHRRHFANEITRS